MPREHLYTELASIRAGVVRMLRLVELATRRATAALVEGDAVLAGEVIAEDDAIDAEYRMLDERIYETFATQAPVAADLRTLLACVRMIGEVERSGDLALTIARAARELAHVRLPVEVRDLIEEMGELAAVLVRRATEAVEALEPDAAERLDLMDDEMDRALGRLHAAVHEAGIDTEAAMRLALVGRFYERIADHAVAVASRVEFLVTGHAHDAHVGY